MWLCTLPSIWPLLEEKEADVWTNFLHATRNSGVHTPLLLEGNKAPKPGSVNPRERQLLTQMQDSSHSGWTPPPVLLRILVSCSTREAEQSLDLGCKDVLVASVSHLTGEFPYLTHRRVFIFSEDTRTCCLPYHSSSSALWDTVPQGKSASGDCQWLLPVLQKGIS